MRKRRTIEKRLRKPITLSERRDNIKIELLLDIRELLVDLRTALAPVELKGEVSIHPLILGTELLEKKKQAEKRYIENKP